MKQGDLAYCTFGPKGFVTIVSAHPFSEMFWNILWNDEILLMHKDHLVCL